MPRRGLRISHATIQTKANPRKQMKTKVLSFSFINFSESGLFNGLPAIQIRKLSASATHP
jgi:hypothetical protein